MVILLFRHFEIAWPIIGDEKFNKFLERKNMLESSINDVTQFKIIFDTPFSIKTRFSKKDLVRISRPLLMLAVTSLMFKPLASFL